MTNIEKKIYKTIRSACGRNKPQGVLGCAVHEQSDGFGLYLNLLFMLTPHVAFTWSAMANFDQDLACRSLLGPPANSVEELIYHNKKFLFSFLNIVKQDVLTNIKKAFVQVLKMLLKI